MNIERIEYRSIGSGPLIGAFAFHIYWGDSCPIDGAKVINIIETFFNKNNFKDKSVYLVNLFEYFSEDESELAAFLTALKEKGYFVIGKFDGQSKPSWLEFLNYRIAVIDAREWFEFDCQEIWYTFNGTNTNAEPPVGENHLRKGTLLYVVPTKDVEAKLVVNFLTKGKYSWRILRKQRPFLIPVYKYGE